MIKHKKELTFTRIELPKKPTTSRILARRWLNNSMYLGNNPEDCSSCFLNYLGSSITPP